VLPHGSRVKFSIPGEDDPPEISERTGRMRKAIVSLIRFFLVFPIFLGTPRGGPKEFDVGCNLMLSGILL